ncbi:MAG TPA: PDZ domain-containing protein, partial [Thermoanaerobaculia bacterium]|nr:PDZ domain-containing protein [Thermoanaerobaculia bacterium]
MQNRRAIAVAGLAISVFFLALMAWRAQVWHERGWTGLRHLPSPPPSMDLPAFIPKAKGGLIDVVMPGSPAEAAGIRMRDVIESIDGIPISDLRAIHRRGDIARSGDTIVYRIVRGGKPRVVPVRSVSPLTFPNVVAGMVTGVVMMFAFLAIALLVIRSRPTSRPAIVFYWFCVLGCIWSAINAFLDLELLSGDGIYPAFSRLSVFASYLAILFVATAFGCVLLHLALVFPRDLPIVQRRPWIIGWLYALPLSIGLMPFAVTAVLLTRGPAMKVTVGVLLALVAVLLVLRPKRRPWIERAGTLCGIALALILSAVAFSVLVPDPIVYALLVGAATVISLGVSLISALGYSLATIAALILGYRRSTAEEKRQLRWPLWGTLTALGVSIIVLMVLLIPGASQHTAMLLFIAGSTRLVYLLIPVTFAFAILKYRLMDIDVVIKKTVVYSIATGVILVAFFVLVAGLGSFLAARLEIRSQMVTVIATLLLAALFVPLRNRVQRAVERRF